MRLQNKLQNDFIYDSNNIEYSVKHFYNRIQISHYFSMQFSFFILSTKTKEKKAIEEETLKTDSIFVGT